MITQKESSDDFYENMTIYPIIEKRINADSTKIYQFLKVIDENIDNRDPELDLKCFPYLFCYGKNGQCERRDQKIQPGEYAKLLMRSADRRFRTDHQFLFFLLNQANIRQLNAGIFHKLNTSKRATNLNAKQFKQMIENNEIEGNLSTIFSRLRGTEQFWKKPRNDIECMISHYGPATFFLTLSPSEYYWDDLYECYCIIYKVKKGTRSLSSFIANDPVIAAMFIEMKYKAIMAFILSEDHPLGKIKHYVVRREYQGRGIEHFHIMLWVEGPPIITGSANNRDEIAAFIAKYIYCRCPNKENFPIISERVQKCQTHHCNKYCQREKIEKGRKITVCRFGYPRRETEELILRGVAEAVVGRRKLRKTRLYDLPRTKAEAYINDYNPAILLAWCGNMDLQYIGEESSTLTQYIMKYATKPEKKNTDDVTEILQNKSAASNLWSLGMRALNNRDCGALEAVDTLLQYPLFVTDRNTVIRWVDVSINRSRKVKSKQELDKMLDNDENIFCPSWVDHHYPYRPEGLENLCLYDFLRWYDIVNTKPTSENVIFYNYGDRYLRKRKSPYLINHYKFNVKKEPESYYHSLLLLFLPWQTTEEIKCGMDTYEHAFLSCCKDLCHLMQYHEKLQDIAKARENLEKEIDQLMGNEENIENEEEGEILGFDLPLENEINDMNNLVRNVDDIPIENQINQLNVGQEKVFDKVKNDIESYCNEWNAAINQKNLNNPRVAPKNVLRMFVSGVGGTGKSHLINVIRKYIPSEFSKEVIVSAPTGIAAYNINGLTLHRLLRLPIEQDGVFKYKPLTDKQLKSLREIFKDVVLLIIDEISMVSNIMLAMINLRLCEIFDTFEIEDGWFGRLNILLLGDLLQLKPVNEEPPFVDISSSKQRDYFNNFTTINLWKELFSYDELTENVRQQSDQVYAAALSEIRLGILSKSSEELLRTREVNFVNANKLEECLDCIATYISKLPNNSVCLFATREQCAVLNSAMLSKLNGSIISLKAVDRIEAKQTKKII